MNDSRACLRINGDAFLQAREIKEAVVEFIYHVLALQRNHINVDLDCS